MNTTPIYVPLDSILEVKASGVDLNIDQDLLLEQGKSIAQLIYDQEHQKKESE